MLVLSILHNIFLTEDEIKRLNNRESIEVTGASLPVWCYRRNTSEPAEEVFCKYKITNENEPSSVKIEKDGYIINLPQIPKNYVEKKLSAEDWNNLTSIEQEQWEIDNPPALSAKCLLPESAGGKEYLYFKEYNKIKEKSKSKVLVHIIELKTMQNLFDSFS